MVGMYWQKSDVSSDIHLYMYIYIYVLSETQLINFISFDYYLC